MLATTVLPNIAYSLSCCKLQNFVYRQSFQILQLLISNFFLLVLVLDSHNQEQLPVNIGNLPPLLFLLVSIL